tara:strand:- start:2434 stop:2616 length:183 start_codon:yes stop_codon:yes gene_type:complete
LKPLGKNAKKTVIRLSGTEVGDKKAVVPSPALGIASAGGTNRCRREGPFERQEEHPLGML